MVLQVGSDGREREKSEGHDLADGQGMDHIRRNE